MPRAVVAQAPARPAAPPPAAYNPYIPSASDYGGVGLLQTRTARFGPDGQLDVGYFAIEPYRRYLVTLQAFPWLEGTFRYTSIDNRSFQGDGIVNTPVTFKDRGADLKLKVWNEGIYRPQFAIGVQDGLGTGLFGGEYMVLSKRVYDLDFSLGMGWGYNGGTGGIKNPFTVLSDRFSVRQRNFGQGGSPSIGDWFTGPEVGLFGGVEYATPIKGVTLKLEYDPNDYKNEPLSNVFDRNSPLNFGVNYRPFEWLDVSTAWERGDLFMFRVSLRANLNAAGIPKFDPPPPAVVPRPLSRGAPAPLSGLSWAEARAAGENAADALAEAVRSQGANLLEVEIRANTLRLALDRQLPAASLETIRQAADTALEGPFAAVLIDSVECRNPQYPACPPMAPPAAISQILDRVGIANAEIAVRESEWVIATSADLSLPVLQDAEAALAATFSVPPEMIVWRSRAVSPPVRRMVAAQRPRRDDAPAADTRAIAQTIMDDLAKERLKADAVDITRTRVTVYFDPARFRQPARNMGRAARIAASHAPASVEEIALVPLGQGMEVSETVVLRRDVERGAAGLGSPEEIFTHASIAEADPGIPDSAVRNPDKYPSFSWALSPQLRQNIGGGDTFYAYQIWAALSGQLNVAKGLNVVGTVGKDIYNTFDDLKVESPSRLPKVRSDIKNYLQQGENNIVRLQSNYLMKLAPELYGRLSAGLFEEMYGGVGGEILFRPMDSRFAAGVDLNWVRQREFDQLFEFRDYSVVTGHLNLYYDVPFLGLLAQVHVGRYLAKDKGATFQVSREFESGIRAGAFFTLTDVPFEVFGEGSFDKGIFLIIPLDLLQLNSSRRQGVFAFRPLTKDGGQRLGIGPRLYDATEDGSLGGIVDSWGTFLN